MQISFLSWCSKPFREDDMSNLLQLLGLKNLIERIAEVEKKLFLCIRLSM